MKTTMLAILIAATAVTFTPKLAAAVFPVKMCIVSGEELGDDPVGVNYKGRNIGLCCKSCVKKFNTNPEKYVAVFDKEMTKRK